FRSQAFGERAEFLDVLFARKWTGTKRMGVSNSHFIFDDGAIFKGNHCLGAECLFIRVMRVVAAGPLGVFDGGYLLPQLDGLSAVPALWGIRVHAVPRGGLLCDRKEIHDGASQMRHRENSVQLLR